MSRTQAVVALSTVLSLSLERRQILLTPSTKETPLDSLAPYLAPSIFCLLSTIFISSSCTPLPVHFLLDLFHFHIYLVSLPSAIQAQLSRFFSLPLNTRWVYLMHVNPKIQKKKSQWPDLTMANYSRPYNFGGPCSWTLPVAGDSGAREDVTCVSTDNNNMQ